MARRHTALRDAAGAVRLAASCGPWLVLAMVAATLVAGLTPAAAAWVTRTVLNDLAAHRLGGTRAVVLALLLGGVGILAAVVTHVQRYLDDALRLALDLAVQDRLCRALAAIEGLRTFETPQFADRLRLAQDSGRTAPARLVTVAFAVVRGTLTAAGFLTVLLAVSKILTAVVLVSAVPAVVAQFGLGRHRAGLQWRISPAVRRQMFYRSLQSDPNAIKEIRLFGLAGFLRGRMMAELRSTNGEQLALSARTLRVQGFLGLLGAVVTAAGLVWTISRSAAGELTVGDVSLFVMAVAGLQGTLAALVGQLADGYEAALNFSHYVAVVDAGNDLPTPEPAQPVPPLRYGIELRDVWFRYDAGHPWILRGVNLFLPYGKAVALMGTNGAGKSTVAKLLCRMYDPDRGAILWDGQDIRQMAPAELRRRIGAVFQDYMTYDLTAAENIGIGDLDRLHDTDAIQRAAQLADADRHVQRLPDGYRTMLSRVFFADSAGTRGQRGVVLSGGQWQRLALARGLMREDRDLLILDEPNSGLDAEAEHDLHLRMTGLRAGRTSLLISHRLGTLRDADVIYVLSAGRVTEHGTHAELMACDGEYRRMFQLQAAGYQS